MNGAFRPGMYKQVQSVFSCTPRKKNNNINIVTAEEGKKVFTVQICTDGHFLLKMEIRHY